MTNRDIERYSDQEHQFRERLAIAYDILRRRLKVERSQ